MEPFYGKEIDPDQQQEEVRKILSKYALEPVSDALKKKIYADLSHAKHVGQITIPFKIVMRKDPSGVHRDFIEVILDTKV
ncbi:MAG: hypothetical protein S4CHLAM2_06570 [Chlamydiales bacterium]|nr:hypothetical protein [Chlamydiales bacterium]